ncbi:hypothetical protein [Vibrio campbellii]|uniref:hypothetical protein n=1 Tax=Vibrio campbellii TaxID=680 RepID=UPI00142E62F4|nr:hypothetical protein [Vibrio campbellii]NIY86366.1 hypothetical protein [Vibrio campbellii]NVK70949.1 hypothetical protein [Vibrio campbellii]
MKKFDLEAARAWANSKAGQPKNIASQRTTERHLSEWSHLKLSSPEEYSSKCSERSDKPETYAVNADVFSVRASGNKIQHGKIRFDEGLIALTGLFELIKSSAKKSLKADGITNAVRNYLNCLYMDAPAPGSFIYKAEVDLSTDKSLGLSDDEIKENARFKRSINIDFAKLLLKLSSSTSEEIRYKDLLELGIDEKLCDSILHLFSSSAEKLEFRFNWSVHQGLDEALPRYILLDNSFRENIKRCKTILSTSYPESIEGVATYIEKCTWVKGADSGKIYFKLFIEGNDVSSHVVINDIDMFEKLKHLVRETVTSDVKIYRARNVKSSLELIDITFDFDKNQQVEIII